MELSTKNVLLIFGGGGPEHEISQRSAEYFYKVLEELAISPLVVEIEKTGRRSFYTNGIFSSEKTACELMKGGYLSKTGLAEKIFLHYAIPCVHGPPGESGHLPAVLEMMGLPFLGAEHQGSILAFNKISTKLYCEAINIPVSPYRFFNRREFAANCDEVLGEIEDQLLLWQKIFIKASEQGSSVGCYFVEHQSEIEGAVKDAFSYSPNILVERAIEGRELEVSVYENAGRVCASLPGEILCPDGFYTYEQKYAASSRAKTLGLAENIDQNTSRELSKYAQRIFYALGLKDLARVDFFLSKDAKIFLNEVNTMPGHTSISMFPQMMEASGLKYRDYLRDRIEKNSR